MARWRLTKLDISGTGPILRAKWSALNGKCRALAGRACSIAAAAQDRHTATDSARVELKGRSPARRERLRRSDAEASSE